MKVFLDSDVLIHVLNASENMLPTDVDVQYFTFQKNIYEYKFKLKQYLSDVTFIIQSIKCEEILQNDNVDFIKRKAYEIIRYVFYKKSYFNIKVLSYALKKYNLDFHLAKMSELFDLSDDEYLAGYIGEYSEVISYPFVQLDLFYMNLYKMMYLCFREIDKKIINYGISEILYQQVFDKEGYSLVEFIHDSQIPPKDLEIVLCAIKTHCVLFLSCDRQLVQKSVSLGFNRATTFKLCSNSSVFEDIRNAILEYKKIYY